MRSGVAPAAYRVAAHAAGPGAVVALIAFVSLTAGCSTGDRSAADTATADTIRIDGSPGVLPVVDPLVAEYRARNPRSAVALAQGLGSRARIDAVADGRIDIAMASHGVVEEDLRQRGMEAIDIALVPVVFAVHSSVSVADLTEAQLCAIYEGRIRNWSEVGGPDMPIAVRTRPVGEVDADVVIEDIECFRNLRPASSVVSIDMPDEMARELQATEGSIGMTSATFVIQSGGRMRSISISGVEPSAENARSGKYPLVRHSYLVVKSPMPPSVARFLDFVRDSEGSSVIARAGGVPPAD